MEPAMRLWTSTKSQQHQLKASQSVSNHHHHHHHHHHLQQQQQQQQQLYPCHIGLKGYGYRLGGLKLETQQNTLPPSSRLSDNIYKEMSGTSCALGIEVAKMFSRNSRLAHRLFRRWTCFLRHMRPLWASAFSLTWWIIKGSMDTAHCMSATNIYELHY